MSPGRTIASNAGALLGPVVALVVNRPQT